MLKRKAIQALEQWFHGPENKALLVKGARQVGKSYLVEAFAREHFSHVAIIDLIEDSRACESLRNASSAEDLLLRLSIAADTELVSGKTAFIIDEIQEAPNVLTYLKYLVQRGDYRYIITGSLLGVKPKNIDSLPVGYLSQVEMFPLDFEEFCWAQGLGENVYAAAAESLWHEEPLHDAVHVRLHDLFHRYMIVGGMPDAVNEFIENKSIDRVRSIQNDLHRLYKDDITKHAPEELRLLLHDIYDLIPAEATSKTRRFKLSDLRDVKRFSQVAEHFLWLTNAGVANPVYNVSAPVSPLLVSEQRNLFKLFYLDVGMLCSRFPKRAYEGLLDGSPTANMGAAYEAFVAQEFRAHGFDLRYFSSKKVGELDFVEEDSEGKVWAFEVKSGSDYATHAALDNALATRGYTIDEAVVLAECSNVVRSGKVLYAPIFMAGAFEYLP